MGVGVRIAGGPVSPHPCLGLPSRKISLALEFTLLRRENCLWRTRGVGAVEGGEIAGGGEIVRVHVGGWLLVVVLVVDIKDLFC